MTRHPDEADMPHSPSDANDTFRLLRPLIVLAALTFGVAVWGCGEPPDGSSCADVTCERGVCNPKTGACTNPTSCGAPSAGDTGAADAGDQPSCLAGFSCVSGSCEADVPCENDDECRSGRCESGACVNPDQCSADKECVEGFLCNDQNQCIENKCDGDQCDRGVCEPETGECINREVCPSPDGEPPACIDGFTCYDQTCMDEQTLCEALDCDRGVCSFEQKECVDADTCSEDSDCLAGKYCEAGTCKPNECDPDSGECDRGVCDPSNGCVNADTCEAADECLPDHYCIDDSCVPTDEACGGDGCPGHQVCSYDPEQLDASCRENEAVACRNAIDCVDDRVCRSGECEAPTECSDDPFEPNDTASESIAFGSAADDGVVTASVCSGDTDVFTFDTTEDSELRGELSVYLEYDMADIGLGPLELTVEDPDGQVVASESTGSPNGRPGRLHVQTAVDASERGVYTLKVTDPGGVASPGVQYNLAADLVARSVADSCQAADTLTSSVQGDTTSGASSAIEAGCAEKTGETTENVYSFTLQSRSYVDITVQPDGGSADLVASLRHTCLNSASETACADAGDGGADERIDGIYPAGTYTLVVQAAEPDAGGAYAVDFSHHAVECTAADNHCLGMGAAKICNDRGKMTRVECDNECNPEFGQCRRPEGDVCRRAVETNGDLEDHTVDWDGLNDTFQGAAGSCPEGAPDSVDGSDKVFRATVPADGGLWARLQPDGSDSEGGSLYLLGDCQNTEGTCLASSEDTESGQMLTFHNDGIRPKGVYLVADSASDTSGTSTLDIQSGPITCSEGETTCQSGGVAVCNAARVGFRHKFDCPGSCSSGQCDGETCSAPMDAGRGGNWTINPENFVDDQTLRANDCTGSALPGPDAVFEVDVMANEVLKAEVTPQNDKGDPSIYITDTCSADSAHARGCRAGADAFNESRRESASIQTSSNGGGTYYVVVDSKNNKPVEAQWNVEIQTHSSVCQPGAKTCASGSAVEYCQADGLGHDVFSCQGSNASCVTSNGTARCDNPTGSACPDAIPVSDGSTVSGDFTGDNHLTPREGYRGSCYFAPGIEMIGKETYYVADLDKGDLLEAELKTESTYGRVYVLDNCLSDQSCLANSRGDQKVTYHADSDQRVYLVVDAISQYRKTLPYDLNVSITGGLHCKPNSSRCTGPNTAAICNESGTADFDEVTCPNGCSNGVCRDDVSRYDTCGNIPNVGDGYTAWGDFARLTSGVDLPPNNCVGSKTEGADAWYAVDVQKGELLTASLQVRDNDRPVLYVASDCSQPNSSCLAGEYATSSGETVRLEHRATQSRTLYVGVDSRSINDPDPFILQIGKSTNQCNAGATRCAGNGQDLEYCTDKGVWKTYQCTGSCTHGQCTQPGGDICFDPLPLQDGEVVSGDFSGTDTSSIKRQQFGGCYLGGSDKTEGPDTFYTMNLRAGDLLRAEFETDAPNALLMITEDCASADACRTNNANGGSTVEYYYADSAQTVQLVVDGTVSQPNGSYRLSVDVLNGRTCAPDETSCIGASTVGICNGGGTAYAAKYQCANGCTDGRCKSQSGGETCSNAVPVTVGTVVTPDVGNFKDNIQVTPNSSCVDATSDGPDTVYKLDVSKGDMYDIRVEATGSESSVAYIITGCKNTKGSCHAGAVGKDGRPAEFVYEAKSNGTVYLVVDSENVQDDEPREVRINKLTPQCSGASRSCFGQDILSYCGPHRQDRAHICNGGCQNGACTYAHGDTCLDAIPMADGDSYTGRLNDFEADLNPGAGQCGIYRDDQAPVGSDAVFAVDLQAGQTLDAQLTTNEDDLGMYVLDECPTQSLQTSCVRGHADTDRLRYRAPTNGTYYLVVDTESPRPDSPFTLDVSVDSGHSCRPGATTCQPGSGNLSVCADDGSSANKTYTCPNGCRDERCLPPSTPNDTCSTATPVDGGIHIIDRFSRFKSNLDPSSASDPCVDNAAGKDAVYSVELDPGETVTADIEIKDDNDTPALYILTDCSAPASSCVAGSQPRRDPTTSTGYYNATGSQQTVYVVADSDGSRVNGRFELDIDVRQGQCDPTSGSADTCKSQNVSRSCTDIGLYEERTCHFGCDNATGSCKPAPNDTCKDAVEIKTTGTYRSDMRHYTNSYENSFGFSLNGCTGGTTRGPDAVYKAHLKKDEVLELSYDAPSEAALWITTDCSQAGRNCVKGVNDSDPDTMTFTAPKEGDYFIIADTDTNSSEVTGEIVIDVTHFGPTTCTPGTVQCKSDGTTLARCDDPGLVREYTCDGGCSNGSCGTPRGEVCADAVPLTSGDTATGRFDSSNAVDPTTHSNPSCSFGGSDDRPVGSDRIYSVDLKAGETLTAEYVSSSKAATLYVMETCGDATTCEATTPKGETGTLQHTAQSDGTVYLVMDRTVPGQTTKSEYKLEVTVK